MSGGLLRAGEKRNWPPPHTRLARPEKRGETAPDFGWDEWQELEGGCLDARGCEGMWRQGADVQAGE